jgi:protein-S-isoprenylcysteine O-methyltransferase Ste14
MTCLGLSIVFVVVGIHFLRELGHDSEISRDLRNSTANEIEKSQFEFEKTTSLVETGIYRFIRHPMYSSLLFLGWGAFLKDFTWVSILLIIGTTIFTFLTAMADERECLVKFGDPYKTYMQKTKRFIPYLV